MQIRVWIISKKEVHHITPWMHLIFKKKTGNDYIISPCDSEKNNKFRKRENDHLLCTYITLNVNTGTEHNTSSYGCTSY